MSSKDQPTQSDIQPEGVFKGHPVTEEPDTEGHVITFGLDTKPAVKVDGAIDETDTEGHMPIKRGSVTEPTGIEPEGAGRVHPYTEGGEDATDAEGHGMRPGHATEPTGIEPEGTIKFRPYTEGDETGMEPDGTIKLRP